MRRLPFATIFGLLIWMVTVGLPATAQAAERVLFSADGMTWSPDPPLLFPAAGRIVPGDTITDSFWVRNSSESTAYFQILADITLADPDVHVPNESAQLKLIVDDLDESGKLLASAQANLGEACINILTKAVTKGGKRQITATVALPWSATNAMRLQRIEIPMAVRGSEVNAPAQDGTCVSPPLVETGTATKPRPPAKQPHHSSAHRPLPQTGAPLGLYSTATILCLSALLIYVGLIVLAGNRREEESEADQPQCRTFHSPSTTWQGRIE